MNKKVIIINGPNLNLLGEREKDKYGVKTLKILKSHVRSLVIKSV